jgi:hypothetical protein
MLKIAPLVRAKTRKTRDLAPSTGLEPVTDGLEIRCSIQLSYEGKDRSESTENRGMFANAQQAKF